MNWAGLTVLNNMLLPITKALRVLESNGWIEKRKGTVVSRREVLLSSVCPLFEKVDAGVLAATPDEWTEQVRIALDTVKAKTITPLHVS